MIPFYKTRYRILSNMALIDLLDRINRGLPQGICVLKGLGSDKCGDCKCVNRGLCYKCIAEYLHEEE